VKHLRRRGKKGRKKEGKREEALGANKGNGEQKRKFTDGEKDRTLYITMEMIFQCLFYASKYR